jgi:N-hydroxyarylamine O-acetyltransferase
MATESSAITQAVPDQAWVERYLAMLGVQREAPSLDALRRLTRAQVTRVPFVNVTAILRRTAHPGDGPVAPLDPEVVLQTWEQRAGGGVCFEHALMFTRLLVGLGYDARRVLGRVGTVAPLGVHQAVAIDLDGARYLADTGNGAPFFDPIPLDGPFEIHAAGLGWRFRPDEQPGWWAQDRLIDGAWEPFADYNLGPVDPAAAEHAYQHLHRPGGGWVVGILTMVHSGDDVVTSVRGDQLTRFTPEGKEVRQLTEDHEFERVAHEVFDLPALPVLEARRSLLLLGRAPTRQGGTYT